MSKIILKPKISKLIKAANFTSTFASFTKISTLTTQTFYIIRKKTGAKNDALYEYEYDYIPWFWHVSFLDNIYLSNILSF